MTGLGGSEIGVEQENCGLGSADDDDDFFRVIIILPK